MPLVALGPCIAEGLTIGAPFHQDASLSTPAQTVARYFPAGPLPLTTPCGHMPGTAVRAVAASTLAPTTSRERDRNFSAEFVTSGAHISHNTTSTPARTTARCHLLPPSSFDAPNTPRFSSDKDKEKSVAQTRAQMEHQTPCHQQLLQCRDRARRGERAQRQRHQPHSTTVSSRQSFTGSPVSAQHGVWEASLLETYLASTDSQVITAMRDAGQLYHQEAQTSDAARRAQFGKPHVHMFRAINADAFLLARRHRQRNSKRSRSTTISFVVAEHARQDLSCRLMMNPAGPRDAAFVFWTAHPSKNSNENIEVSR